MLGFNGEVHRDLIEQGVRFTFRHGMSLLFDMILHGLSHQRPQVLLSGIPHMMWWTISNSL